jgi:hypothetical protein
LYPRNLLIRALQIEGHIKAFGDYCQVIAALTHDHDKDAILGMTELQRWPKAAVWLKDRL